MIGPMADTGINLAPLARAGAALDEALQLWDEQHPGTPLKRQMRLAVIQSLEFVYELSIQSLRRVLIERSASSIRVVELSFNDLLRAGADAGLIDDSMAWRRWRDLRNATSHAYNEAKAEEVAHEARVFAADARRLRLALESHVGG